MEEQKSTLQVSQTEKRVVKLPIFAVWIVSFILIGIGLVAGYFLFSPSKQISVYNAPTPTVTARTYFPPEITTKPPSVNSKTTEYILRHFIDNQAFFHKFKYPTELTSLSDSSLKLTQCGFFQGNYGYDKEQALKAAGNDTDNINYLNQLYAKYPDKWVYDMFSCKTKDNVTVILYSIGPCGGGCAGIPYIGTVKDSQIKEISKVSGNIAYFGCRVPLLMTVDNMFYFQCGGGDGPGASSSIYKLDINQKSLTSIYHCESGIDEKQKHYERCE